MDQYRIFKIMERVWLGFAVITLLLGAWFLSKGQWEPAKFPFFVAACCFVLFGLRRYQRKKIEKSMENKNRKQ